jgi:hypothetical protein
VDQEGQMIVDCMTCPVRGQRCDDCVASVLLELGPAQLPLDAAERRAVSTFVGAGLASVETAAGLFARHEPRQSANPQESAELWRVAGVAG